MVCTAGGYGLGRVYGWVLGRVIPGTTQPHCKAEHVPAKRAPEGLQGLEWVGTCIARPSYPDHPLRCAPGPAPLSGYLSPGKAASGPIKARFHDIYTKVSQKRGVSPKYVHKACHSPCSQNTAQKSPLEILRFTFIPAFSHKELMAHFDA